MQNTVDELKVVIRQEQNTAKIMSMENEVMLNHVAREKDNLHKL